MRSPAEMRRLYRFARALIALVGIGSNIYGAWILIFALLSPGSNPDSWFGIFPIYLGSMLILVSLAMKEDWFTNARKYW